MTHKEFKDKIKPYAYLIISHATVKMDTKYPTCLI